MYFAFVSLRLAVLANVLLPVRETRKRGEAQLQRLRHFVAARAEFGYLRQTFTGCFTFVLCITMNFSPFPINTGCPV